MKKAVRTAKRPPSDRPPNVSVAGRRETDDAIWKALADRTRRELLDVLAERPQTTGELVERFNHLCRTNVMKHLNVLAAANLILVRREGRTRWNYLNPAPIQAVCDRWVSKARSTLGKCHDAIEGTCGRTRAALSWSLSR